MVPAVAEANKANGDTWRGEREGLTDFRRHASLSSRHELGVAFATFEARHVWASSRWTRTRRSTIEPTCGASNVHRTALDLKCG